MLFAGFITLVAFVTSEDTVLVLFSLARTLTTALAGCPGEGAQCFCQHDDFARSLIGYPSFKQGCIGDVRLDIPDASATEVPRRSTSRVSKL